MNLIEWIILDEVESRMNLKYIDELLFKNEISCKDEILSMDEF